MALAFWAIGSPGLAVRGGVFWGELSMARLHGCWHAMLLIAALPAYAKTYTYTYTGVNYTAVTPPSGSCFSTSQHLAITVVTTAAIPPGSNDFQVAVRSWTVNDGVTTYHGRNTSATFWRQTDGTFWGWSVSLAVGSKGNPPLTAQSVDNTPSDGSIYDTVTNNKCKPHATATAQVGFPQIGVWSGP